MTELWFECLKKLTGKQVREGFTAYLSNPDLCDFPPKPGQIIKLSGYVEQPPSLLDTERQREEEYKLKQEIK